VSLVGTVRIGVVSLLAPLAAAHIRPEWWTSCNRVFDRFV
jgi:hypothetical protein